MAEEKKIYKKFKVIIGCSALIIETIMLIVSRLVAPEAAGLIQQLMLNVFILAAVIIGGHTATDIAAMMKKKEE